MADIIWSELRVQTDKSKKEVQSLNKEISTTGKVAKKSGDEATKSYNQQAAATNKATQSQSLFQKGVGGVTGGIKSLQSTLGPLAASMGVAFGTQQIIEFGKASVEAFIEAEKNAQLLLFALKNNEYQQQRLLDQAGKLQGKTIFEDDTIIQAQTFLATQGRTVEQIEKVINAAVELSTVTGTDLNTAVMQLDATLEGNVGRLGKLDSGFKGLTKEQLQNGAALDLLIEKYGGTAEAMGNTTAGQVAKLKNQFGELQETVGGEVLPILSGFVKATEGIAKGDFQTFFKNIAAGQFVSFIADSITGTNKVNEELTDLQKNTLLVGAATDKEIIQKFQELGGETTVVGQKFKAFAEQIRTDLIKNTFEELNRVLELTEKRYAEMVDITDKYGVSALVTADGVLQLKQANEELRETTFNNLNKTLGVTRKDFNEYLGIVDELKPKTDDLTKSTEKLIGPYDRLTQAVNTSMKALQDQVTLFSKGRGSWEDAIKLAQKYADAQNTLVEVNDLVTLSLKRQTHEGLLPLADANTIVLVTENKLIERFKFTEEMALRRNELFEQLGVNQVDIYKKTLSELEKLQAAEIRASDGTLKSITEITNKYTKAITVLQLQQASDLAGAFAGVAKNLTSLLTNIFGEAAQKNIAFLAFTKSIAIAEITLSSFQAIAAGIAKLASANPLDVIGGISAIIGGVSNFIGGIISQVENVTTPSVPAFEKGTGFVTRGNNPPGVDTVPALLTEGEGVVTKRANSAYPGLVDAMNMGIGDDYIMKHFVEPVLRAEEKSLPDQLAASMMLQKGKDFDDFRLYRTGRDQVSLLRENNSLLRKSLSQNRNNRNVN